jgi:hypothetical protein
MMAIASLVLSAVMTIDGLGAATQGASPGDHARPLMNACGANTTASVGPRDAIAHCAAGYGTPTRCRPAARCTG